MRRKFTFILAALLAAGVLGFAIGPGLVEKSLNQVEDHEPYLVSDTAQKLHRAHLTGL